MTEISHTRPDGTDQRPLHQTDYSPTDEDGIAISIIDVVAEAAGVSPFDIDEQLYNVVDPDALEAVFRTDALGPGGYVRFAFAGFEVVTHSSGVISVYDA